MQKRISGPPAGLAPEPERQLVDTADLKQALEHGTQQAVALLGRENGYFGNPRVKIPLSESIARADRALRKLGQGKTADEFVHSLNRGVPVARTTELLREVFGKWVPSRGPGQLVRRGPRTCGCCGRIAVAMLRNIKQFFDQHIRPAGGERAGGAQHALQVATAALLIEVVRTDSDIHDAERHALTAAIQARFELTPDETAALLRLAEEEAAQATDYYQFTALINEHLTPAQKEQVIENMWQVAAADQAIDRFERTLVHKVADLLHVPRTAQIAARERALRAPHPRAGD